MVSWNLYNMTAMQNSTGGTNMLLTLFRETSAATNYLPGTFILVAFFFVLFLALRMKNAMPKVAFAAAAWACTLLALIMYPLQIISSQVYIIFIVLTPIAVLILFFTNPE